ncbi:hypothetical protein BDY17DRAFT_302761 [Neohortaea acidophila]|uniref:RRM domain-containing protein n=1 Tax=Neohortaea acidophila TaxID=245834 RepID=A0A6A6PJG8_9PEZI|nr:uncharacterized protein BDY17DRAFT_302761 [Neohortaea acidophila]KAF2479834.1 hypothetical protein BDY17DRAFT_302761 [Neohortaea acidophila]
MAAQTTKKRKSAGDTGDAVKRVKVAKSAEKTAPLKSALKKAKTAPAEAPAPKTEKKLPSRTTKSKKPDTSSTAQPIIADDNDAEELTPDQTAALLAGFSSSEDEGGDADDSEDEAGISISTLPKPPTKGLIKKRINQAIADQVDPETTPGVIYIGRIPHGFYEAQMKAYFSQFGEIINLRLGRNRKTGKSQHHGFIEFASAAVAEIVVKTMDKYLLFGHLLQVRRVPREQVKESMFQGSGRKRKPAPRNRLEGSKLKRGAAREVWAQRVEKENMRRAEKAEKLKGMGYEFDMPVVKDVGEVPVKQKMIGVGEEPAAVVAEETPSIEHVAEAEVVQKKRSARGKTETKKVVKKAKK